MEKDSNNERNKNSGKIVVSIFLILLLFVSVIGITYAVFAFEKAGEKQNKITIGSLTFSYAETSNGISLSNAMPVSDSVGKSLMTGKNGNGYFDFNVSCNIEGTATIKYEIYAKEEAVSNKINSDYIKVYLTDGTTDRPVSGYNNTIPIYSSLPNSSVSNDFKRLYLGNFNSKGTQYFRLRMWISDNYSIPTSSQNYKIKVGVKADS